MAKGGQKGNVAYGVGPAMKATLPGPGPSKPAGHGTSLTTIHGPKGKTSGAHLNPYSASKK